MKATNQRSGIGKSEQTVRKSTTKAILFLVATYLNRAAVTQEKIDRIHLARLEAGAWTVNTESEMKRLLALGVDRIYTDYPRRLLRIVQETRPASRKDSNHE